MKWLILLFLQGTCCLGFSQTGPGIFDRQQDIGYVRQAGSGVYDSTSQEYTIRGSGANIWFNEDQFHYVYKKIAGDFLLTADFAFTGDAAGSVGHRKMGWMIRESADANAASINATDHIDGLVVLQWRELGGAFMRDPQDEIFYPKKGLQTIQLERRGKKIIMRMANPGEPLQWVGEHEMPDMKDSVLAGLFICSHDSNALAAAKVWNVRMDRPVENTYQPNPQLVRPPTGDILGSRVEIMTVADGKRRILYESPGRLAEQGWAPDGQHVLFSAQGEEFSVPVAGGQPARREINKIKTAGTESSAGTKYIFYAGSSHGTMQIWRSKPDGSGKEQLSFDACHNWFPHVSPDGKWVVFLSYQPDINPREHPAYQRVMLRLMPATGGAPRVIAYLYGGEDTLNVPCWSPDSKQIVFISNSGKP